MSEHVLKTTLQAKATYKMAVICLKGSFVATIVSLSSLSASALVSVGDVTIANATILHDTKRKGGKCTSDSNGVRQAPRPAKCMSIQCTGVCTKPHCLSVRSRWLVNDVMR